MRNPLLLVGLAALFLGACANQAQTYLKTRTGLTPEQQKIITTGKIPPGEVVAGMTREDIRVAMGGDPATFDRIGAEDAWVYKQRKAVARKTDDTGAPSSSSNRSSNGFIDAPELGPRIDVEVQTTVFFQGNRATHAQITEERP